jgi:hypothetical protein
MRCTLLVLLFGCATTSRTTPARGPLVVLPSVHIDRARVTPTQVCREYEPVLTFAIDVRNASTVTVERLFVHATEAGSGWGGGEAIASLAPGEIRKLTFSIYYPPGGHEYVVRVASFQLAITSSLGVFTRSMLHNVEPPCKPAPNVPDKP